jgi:NADPH2:quinone reductase
MLRALAHHGTLVTLGFTGGREVVLDVLDLIGGDKKIAGYGIHAESDANIASIRLHVLR